MNKIKRILGGGGRFIVLLLLIAITFSYAMFQGGFVSWFLFYTISPFLLYSLLLSFAPIQIGEVHCEIKPSKLHRGDSAQVKISFQNKSWFPFVFLTVKELDSTTGPSQIFFVGWKRKFEWTYELHDVERGAIQFKGLHLTVTDFFGWTIRNKVIQENKTVLVYPKLSEIKYKPLQLQFEHGSINAPFSMVKDTSIVTGVRDYQAGDKFSWIHWKSFAKNATLRTKEFEDRQTQEIMLVIDQSTDKNFDDVVDLVASIITSVVKNHGDISFLSSGEKRYYSPKIKTHSQLEKVMQHLATIRSDTKKAIDATLANEVGLIKTASLIIVTGEVTDGLKQFFSKSSSFTRGIICFEVTDQEKQVRTIANVKVMPISKGKFEQAFTEVVKP
ncbi:uncharacterized protein SAMN05880501_10293 [Ureibacillus xyleni]|uniref:DUF58 domain-containing protein n=1 Tax=Ureibacillus xyleni TaxID=614648 RepID=A0A285S154_9BACL|nr:DUF58 domain-containing protein [Ureibacillus xyleni]SOB98769.1 uncharacterized protein SAMN05880501_10293 [Ureibacillus xyleni]